ncbi:hypothetical protein ACWEJ6_20960 [Nonomuraea sp. NPDC004702]
MADRTVTTRLKLAVTDFVAGGRQAKSTLKELDRKFSESAGFAAGFRKKLEDAAKRLPPIDIDVNSSAADVKIAEIRSRLESLSSKTVGVDIDAAEAYAEMQALQRELEALDDKDVAFEVKAGVAQAMAELRSIDSEINRVDGRTATVTIDADAAGALRSIAMVGAALASLPAVTTLAVGVTALGGAFAAAGIGAAAFGAVAVPALSRINDALKAQETAAKSAGGATGGAGQSAAQAAQQAMQLEQAERRLKDAQNEERAAQEDLTRAREAGRRALEDMNFSLERSILSQKDAALAVREAEARLADVQGKHDEGKASDLELERAMLGLEMAQQRSREQEVKTQRARKDTAAANREGVKGTKEYQAGLDKLKQAQDKVAQAEAQLKQLHLQQQAAMSGGGGGAAKLKDAFADLNKQEIALAKNIKTFKDEYVDWQRSLEPDVFPVINQGLDLMRLGLQEAGPLAKSASVGLLAFGQNAEKALTGPFWQQFLFNLNTQIPGAMTGLGDSFINVTTGVAGLIDAFLPFTPTVVGGVEKASQAFSEWGQNLKNSPEFHEFIAYVKENAPEVLELAKNLAKSLGNIGEAVAPLGVGAFSGLSLLAKLTAGMDPEHIRLIAVAIIAIKAAQAGLGIARFFLDMPGKLGALRDGFDKAKTGASKLGDAVGGLGDKLGGVGAIAGGVATAGGLILLEERFAAATEAAGKFVDVVKAGAGDNLDQQIAAVTQALKEQEAQQGANIAEWIYFTSAGKIAGDRVDALSEELDKLNHQKEIAAIRAKVAGDALGTMGGAAGTATTAVGGLTKSLSDFAGRTDALQAVQNMKKAYNDAEQAINAANGKLQVNASMTDKQRDAVIVAREKFAGYIDAVRLAADGAATLSGKTTDGTRTILEQLPKLGQLAGKNSEAREQILLLAQAYGISRTDAEKAMLSAKGLRDMLAQLKSREIEITANTQKAKDSLHALLQQFIKPYDIPIGIKAPSTPPKKKAAGGIQAGGVDLMAAGGIKPMVANQATFVSGSNTVFAEAGKEAYIPYASQYRDRAIALLAQVANDFGLQLGNQQAAKSLSDLSVTIDASGMQVAGGLQAVMGALQSTMGQAGSLTSSIGKVGASAAELDQSWLSGSQVIGDSIDLLGTGVSDMSSTVAGSVDGLTGSVYELTQTMASIKEEVGASAKKSTGSTKAGSSKSGIGASATKSMGSLKGKSGGFVDGNQPKKSTAGGMVSGSQPVTGYASSGPVNASKVSKPQQISGSYGGLGGSYGAGANGSGSASVAPIINKTVNFNGTTIKETVDSDILWAKADLYTRG